MRIRAVQGFGKGRAAHEQAGRLVGRGQGRVGAAAEHGVERSDCLLFGREALDPLALEAGLLDLGTDRVLLCRTAQGVANAGDLFDLAEEDDAPIEHSDRLVCVPVACVGRLGISQEVARRGDAVEAERDLVVSKINAKPGDSLAVDAVIMEFG